MTCQDFPRKRGYARLFFVAALLTLLLPLQVARAAMTGWAAGVEVPADFGEEIHTGEEATARVLSVRAAGPVEQGAGHVVTGTFQTWNADVRELWMEGLEAPVRVTGGHRFYSASRGWVEAHRLAVGETVRTRDGSGARVLGLERLPGVHAVFNLEVEGLHQYHVSPLGLLAHNNKKCETTNTSAQKTKGANEAAESRAKSTGENAIELRSNIEKEGRFFAEGEAAGHIVASTGSQRQWTASAESRSMLDKYRIGVNDAANGVPVKHHRPHNEMHTRAFNEGVRDRLQSVESKMREGGRGAKAIRSALRHELRKIGKSVRRR